MRNKLPPFKWFINENFPFIEEDFDAITNYQLLSTFINKCNELGIQVEKITEWFNNLDVQDEINNKLDDMAESGELEEIIASYLNTNALICFDTVSEMKLSENLVDGSYAKTLGYHSKNDGGDAIYKVRTITNDDIVDESLIIALADNSLIAELMIPDVVNPEMFGAYGDGVHDDIIPLKKAIDTLKTVRTTKEYLISEELPIKFSFIMENQSRIICDSTVDDIGVSITKDSQRNNCTYDLNVDGQGYPATTVAIGKPRKCNVKINVLNAGTVGIETAHYGVAGNGGNTFTFHVIGNSEGTTQKGILVNSYDSIFDSIVAQDCLHGVEIYHGELVATSVHCWLSNELAPTLWTNSYALYIGSYDHFLINWLYQDSIRYGIGGTAPYGEIILFDYNNTLTNADTLYNNELNINVTSGTCRTIIQRFSNYKNESKRISYTLADVNTNEFGVTNKNGINSNANQVGALKMFTDANNAPQIGNYLVTYDITNLPVEQGGTLCCEIVGSNYIQTYYSNNYANNGYFYKRFRKNTESTWSSWNRYIPSNAT